MKTKNQYTFLAIAYSLLISAILLAALWFLFPIAICFPKLATLILLVMLITPMGATARSYVEVKLLMPYVKLLMNNISKTPILVIFGLSLAVSLSFPWVHRFEGWKVWHWITAIAYTAYSFETFYSFLLGIGGIKS